MGYDPLYSCVKKSGKATLNGASGDEPVIATRSAGVVAGDCCNSCSIVQVNGFGLTWLMVPVGKQARFTVGIDGQGRMNALALGFGVLILGYYLAGRGPVTLWWAATQEAPNEIDLG